MSPNYKHIFVVVVVEVVVVVAAAVVVVIFERNQYLSSAYTI
jgi:hypothetical protein